MNTALLGTSSAAPISLRDALSSAQKQAMRDRNRPLLSVLRSANAAIANAEAIPMDALPAAGAIEAAVPPGVADAPRRELSDDEVVAIIRAEIADTIEAADQQSRLGRPDEEAALRAGAEVLSCLVAECTGHVS